MLTKLKIFLLFIMLVMAFTQSFAQTATTKTPDPSGVATGSSADVTAAKSGAPTTAELSEQVGKNKVGINMVWLLITGFLVFFMQAGFALVETGLTLSLIHI